jgi:biotin carboxyl carrier protein
MPGRVIKIVVKVNDSVKSGDTLLILEAMKMQNEIKAGIEGKIKSISVSEGAVVDPSVSMIEIAPDLSKD